jgi:hypothetical protein
MEIQSLCRVFHPNHSETTKRPRLFLLLILALIVAGNMMLCSCEGDGEPIDKPDEFTHVYQASEKHILRAIYQTFRDKDMGSATINEETHEVISDYIAQGEWRIRSLARIRMVKPNEREVTLSISTEKKTPTGWELRRLLKKEQYERLFNAIDTQIYREMAKPD